MHRNLLTCSLIVSTCWLLAISSLQVHAQEKSEAAVSDKDSDTSEATADQAEESTKPETPAGHSFHGEAFNEGPRQSAYLMEGLGRVRFPVTTSSKDAQAFIEQGVAQLHGFWYFEAERSFRQAAALDPECAMAYWGMAMANENNNKRAKGFIEEAVARKEKTTKREQKYIDALSAYLKADSKKKKERNEKYTDALEKLLYEFPDDVEAKAFLALQLWKNRSAGLPITSHLAVDALLQQVFDAEPMHPAHHYRIHLWDYEKAEHALSAAARCGQSLPAIAHMWHMPGHIYSRLKRYQDAAWQQEASARVDHAHMMRDRVMPDQIHNFAHNNEWLIRNLNHVGRIDDALDLAKNMTELPRHPKYNVLGKRGSTYYGRLRLFETLSLFERWDELIALAESTYLQPTDSKDEQIKRLRHLIRAGYRGERLEVAQASTEALEKMLESEEAAQQKAEEEAVAKLTAKREKEAAKKAEPKEKEQKKSESDEAGDLKAIPAACDPPGEDAIKQEPTKQEPTKQEPTKQEPTKQEATKQEATKQEPTKQEATKEDAKQDAAKENSPESDQEDSKSDEEDKSDEKEDKELKKARTDAAKPFTSRIRKIKQALDEAAGLKLVRDEQYEEAHKKLKAASGVDAMYLAHIEYLAGKHDDALKNAKKHIERHPNEVQPLAMYTQLLWQADQQDEARAQFEKLREISSQIQFGSPVFARMETVAKVLGYDSDWRIEAELSDDVGERPSLDDLGPFRWSPSEAPSWTLKDADNKTYSLKQFQGQPIVLIFYLGYGCLHCAEQLHAFAPEIEKFEKAGISLLAISTDDADGLKLSLAGYESGPLPIPLLANSELDIFRSYRAYDDFEQQPLHGTFLIDGEGQIRWQDISYEPFMNVDFVLEESKRLLAQ